MSEIVQWHRRCDALSAEVIPVKESKGLCPPRNCSIQGPLSLSRWPKSKNASVCVATVEPIAVYTLDYCVLPRNLSAVTISETKLLRLSAGPKVVGAIAAAAAAFRRERFFFLSGSEIQLRSLI